MAERGKHRSRWTETCSTSPLNLLCVSLSLSLSLSLSRSLALSISQSLSLSLCCSLSLSISSSLVSAYLSLFLFLCPSLSLSSIPLRCFCLSPLSLFGLAASVCLPACLSACLPVRLSVRPSIRLSVCPSVRLSLSVVSLSLSFSPPSLLLSLLLSLFLLLLLLPLLLLLLLLLSSSLFSSSLFSSSLFSSSFFLSSSLFSSLFPSSFSFFLLFFLFSLLLFFLLSLLLFFLFSLLLFFLFSLRLSSSSSSSSSSFFFSLFFSSSFLLLEKGWERRGGWALPSRRGKGGEGAGQGGRGCTFWWVCWSPFGCTHGVCGIYAWSRYHLGDWCFNFKALHVSTPNGLTLIVVLMPQTMKWFSINIYGIDRTFECLWVRPRWELVSWLDLSNVACFTGPGREGAGGFGALWQGIGWYEIRASWEWARPCLVGVKEAAGNMSRVYMLAWGPWHRLESVSASAGHVTVVRIRIRPAPPPSDDCPPHSG